MSVKTPHAVVSFENVPADAADPVVDIYVNNEKVSSGGGGGGADFVRVIPLIDDDGYFVPEETLTYNDVDVGIVDGLFYIFEPERSSGRYAICYMETGDSTVMRLTDQMGSTFESDVSGPTDPLKFYIPD